MSMINGEMLVASIHPSILVPISSVPLAFWTPMSRCRVASRPSSRSSGQKHFDYFLLYPPTPSKAGLCRPAITSHLRC
jgi:hypothetical protein